MQITQTADAWIGYAWVGCSQPYTRPRALDTDYGTPVGECTEVPDASGGGESGVFVREWSKATVKMDCNTWTGDIAMKSDDIASLVGRPRLKSDDIEPASGNKPNIIFCLVDDWGYNDVGYHNAENEGIIRTPNMDRLSSSMHGIRLEKFYSQPICTPTRSQTLTGRYQIHTGLQHGVLWLGQENGLPTNETTCDVQDNGGTL